MSGEDLTLLQRFLSAIAKCDIKTVATIGSFFMSIVALFRTISAERVHLCFSVLLFRSKGSTAYMILMIENCSRLPACISQISLDLDGEIVNCVPFAKEVITGTKKVAGKLTERPPKCSAPLPIQLFGLSSTSCIVLFEGIPAEIPRTATHLNFVISTNRGKKVRKKLQLPEEWADQTDIP